MALTGFDKGSEGSQGPWLSWSARGTQDGNVPAKSFLIRSQDGKDATDAPKKGFVFDVHSLKTGWQADDGGPGKAPSWKWGDDPSSLPQRPGEGWKKGFSVRVALGGDQTANWEQAGTGAWESLAQAMDLILKGPITDTGKVPVLKMVSTEEMKFGNGSSTCRPVFELVKWIDRPDSLADGAGGFDSGSGAADEPPKENAGSEDELSF